MVDSTASGKFSKKSSISDSCKILSAMLADKKAHTFVPSLTGSAFIFRGFKHGRSSSAAIFWTKCSIEVAWLIFKLMTSTSLENLPFRPLKI